MNGSVYDHVPGEVILAGVVGSTAYGLAGPDSDRDRLGVYAAPTRAVLGLREVKESVVVHEPSDVAVHEARKFLKLAMSVNPTITELLWLPDSLYEVRTALGSELVDMRESLLTADRVRDAYLGYARSQFTRLQDRGDSFSSDTKNRTAKHARHMARLVNQGFTLYTTGSLTVQVDDPQWYHDFSNGTPEMWSQWFLEREADFDAAVSVLPESPDTDRAEEWLLKVRETYF